VLTAGNGGNAPGSGFNGNGGSITLQPGSQGTGGASGFYDGNVIIAPTVGSVLVGPASSLDGKLVVKATFTAIFGESSSSAGVFGTSGSQAGVYGSSSSGTGVSGYSSGGNGVFGQSTNDSGVRGFSTNDYGVEGFSSNKAGVYGTSSLYGVQGDTSTGTGVFGKSTSSGTGVFGTTITGKGVSGHSNSNMGVYGESFTGDGVRGQSNSGYAGNFIGKSRFTGNMEIGGNELFGAVTRQMINLYNLDYGIGIQNSTLYFRVANTAGYNWYMGGINSNTINSPGAGGVSLMKLSSAGNLTVAGSVSATNFVNSSDRALKSDFASVNPRAVLDRLAALPVQTWNYKTEDRSVRHMGPMAQDFKAAFGLGADDKHISTVDAAGVTMAAVQGLYQLSLEKDKKIERLTAEVDDLKARLQRLEEAVRGRQK
jgi:trimeric autotransporter adhesin